MLKALDAQKTPTTPHMLTLWGPVPLWLVPMTPSPGWLAKPGLEPAVPLIQFTLSGVAVDLKFCRVERRTVDPRTFDATKGKHLSLVEDDKCMRSLSGTLIGAAQGPPGLPTASPRTAESPR